MQKFIFWELDTEYTNFGGSLWMEQATSPIHFANIRSSFQLLLYQAHTK